MWFAVPRSFHFVLKNKTLNLSILARLSDLRQFVNMTSHLVFVYGTLKRGQPNHEKMTNPDNGQATFIGEARTVEKWPLVIATKFNIPFMLDKPGLGHNFVGEVFSVDDAMLKTLDMLERHPHYYRRKPMQVKYTHLIDSDAASRCNMIANEGAMQDCDGYILENCHHSLMELPFLELFDTAVHEYHRIETRDMPPKEQREYLERTVHKH
ncbi:troponin C-akin-1 protein-like isoform X3 [Amphiura filiformis]|uniref:troponin C-akin-1 protein-like isoform X3 n=1 Tax=Amphiura filiformis TaxID=82378 RepID=UPI003B2145BE